MEQKTQKCVIVLDGGLPGGLAANTAAILGISLGKALPEMVGAGVADGSGREHPGIVAFPVPVLRGTEESLRQIRQRLEEPAFRDLTAVDFSALAQSCKTYEEYQERMSRTPEGDLRYLGIALCGPKKEVNRLTGSMPLLR